MFEEKLKSVKEVAEVLVSDVANVDNSPISNRNPLF